MAQIKYPAPVLVGLFSLITKYNEAKFGDYQQHITNYYRMFQIFNLNSEHSIMVITDVLPENLVCSS